MESVIGVLEGRDETEKIEVLTEQGGDSEARLHLRSLSWGEGIGWFPQKTIVLNCKEIDRLQTLLSQASAIIKTRPQRKPRSKGKILPFPARRPIFFSGREKAAERNLTQPLRPALI